MVRAMVGDPIVTQRFNVPSNPVRNSSSPEPKITCAGPCWVSIGAPIGCSVAASYTVRRFARRDDLRAVRAEPRGRELADAASGPVRAAGGSRR